MRRTLALAACAPVAALALSACGEMKNQIDPVAAKATPLSLARDGTPSSIDAGLYEARGGGWLARAGVSLSVQTAADSARSLSLVESGRADVGIVSEPTLMQARNRGATVLAFGAITQRPLSAVVAIRSRHHRLRSLSGLAGKSIGVSGDAGDRAILGEALKQAGLTDSVREVTLSPGRVVAALLSGRVAAAFGGVAAEQVAALRARHKQTVTLSVRTHGTPTYDDQVLVCTEDFFADHVNLLRRFVQATGRGYEALRADPSTGIDALHAADPSLDTAIQSTALQAEIGALFPADGRPWGWQNQGQWNAFGRWMTARGLIGGPKGWVYASTNQLLAGQGP